MALWLADRPLVLASKSQARRSLLEAARIPVETHPADLDERALEAKNPGLKAGDAALLLAQAKAQAVAVALPGRLVVGADQVLVLRDTRFSKPPDRSAARAQLQALRGRTHTLHSAVAVVLGADMVFAHLESANLTMRAFSDQFLDAYLDATGSAATASVGAYQVEGLGIHLFERIEGDHSTILGLPLLPLLNFLRQARLVAE